MSNPAAAAAGPLPTVDFDTGSGSGMAPDVACPPIQSSRIIMHRRLASQSRRRSAFCSLPWPSCPAMQRRSWRWYPQSASASHAAMKLMPLHRREPHVSGTREGQWHAAKRGSQSTRDNPCKQQRTHMERIYPATCLVVGRQHSSCAHETLAVRLTAPSQLPWRAGGWPAISEVSAILTCQRTGQFPAWRDHLQGSGACGRPATCAELMQALRNVARGRLGRTRTRAGAGSRRTVQGARRQ